MTLYQGIYGCWFVRTHTSAYTPNTRHYLPQVNFQAHTTIQSTASRTRLRQTFLNNTSSSTPEVQYSFPLYDGVSVVSFKCTIGDKVIYGVVKEKNEARTEYKEAVARGEAAGLLEQMHEASDIFSTKVGNIPQNGKAIIEIEYVGELKHDAQLDGTRFTIPTSIAPRYGTLNADSSPVSTSLNGKIEIVVDVEVDENAHIEGLSSPSHPIAMSMGRISTQKDSFRSNRASATLSLGSSELGNDFIIVVNSQEQGVPKALLEDHPDIPNHRALMATLVPKFSLPNIYPEIVFIVDRSGSMSGKIPIVVEAIKVFLKSLPLSAKFNICSFGSHHRFLFPQSLPYDERSLQRALREVETFQADYGGTELLAPIEAAVKQRLSGVPLEIMVLTDGEIFNQQDTFDFVNQAAKKDVRLFSLGIGTAVSTSLVEGLARAGNGFAQFVQDNEKMDKLVVRMLKAALSPHISDYHLQVNYEEEKFTSDDGFEVIEPENVKPSTIIVPKVESKPPKPISLFDTSFKESSTNPPASRYDHLPNIAIPNELQAPHKVSGLFPFNRVCTYLLLPDCKRSIKSVLLRGTYNKSPIELEIAVQHVGKGKTIHQLAAKKAMLETEEGRGWLSVANTSNGTLLQSKHTADWERIIEREAVRLGVQFQVAGKFCSFVAVESHSDMKEKIVDMTESQQTPPPYSRGGDAFCLRRRGGYVAPAITSLPISGDFDEMVSERTTGSIDYNQFMNKPTGGLFGNSQQASNSRKSAPASRGGLFGSATAPKTSSFGFGGSTFRQKESRQASTKSKKAAFGWGSPSRSPQALFGAAPPPPPAAAAPGSSTFGAAAATPEYNLDFSTLEKEEESEDHEADGLFEEKKTDSFSFSGPPKDRRNESATLPGNATTTSLGRARGKTSDTVETKIHKIIALQRFDGSWTASDNLFKLVEVWKGDFVDASMKYEDETVNATILAIAWLEKEASKDKEIWEMVADKAKHWLATKHGIADADDAVRQAIMIFFP